VGTTLAIRTPLRYKIANVIAMLFAAAIATTDIDTVTIRPEPLNAGRINPMQCGQFMEYLCTLFPGMWSEKLCDTGFEGISPYKMTFIAATDFKDRPWYPTGQVNRSEWSLSQDNPLNGVTCGKLHADDGLPSTVSVSQEGVAIASGESSKFSIWLRASSEGFPVHVRLHKDGHTIWETQFAVGADWKKYSSPVNPKGGDPNATMTIEIKGPGTVWMDSCSLMPDDSVHGWRKDVFEALKELKPAVIRIGGSVMDDPNLGDFQWSNTIGDPDFRKPLRAWGGLQPTGPGIEEFVQLCHLVDAEPLICVRVRERTPQDAADEVEYFNGPASSKMGALRAKNGHAEPYNVKYWQVGNERSGEAYWHSLPDFCKAMKAADPSIKLMSSFPSDDLLKLAGQYLDYICPHQYDAEHLQPELDELTDIRRMIKENGGGRDIKVGVTEWNTTAGDWGPHRAMLWTLENALACSRYHNVMQRNCDLIEIANRSNLTDSFCSGIIQTDASRMYLTPCYYAQWLYSHYQGVKALTVSPSVTGNEFDLSATSSEDGKTVTMFVINGGGTALTKRLDLSGFGGLVDSVKVWTLADTEAAGEPDVTNGFSTPHRVAIKASSTRATDAGITYTFAPYTLTVLRVTAK
jgi:alpha-N-arabinofuranosidase